MIFNELISGFLITYMKIVFLEYILCSSSSHSMTSASSRPARATKRGHPLGLPLLLHLRLHPHRNLPPPGRLFRRWGDQAHPGQGAHGLRSHGACGDESTVLSHDVPRRCSDSCLPVERQMWATLASAQVCTSA